MGAPIIVFLTRTRRKKVNLTEMNSWFNQPRPCTGEKQSTDIHTRQHHNDYTQPAARRNAAGLKRTCKLTNKDLQFKIEGEGSKYARVVGYCRQRPPGSGTYIQHCKFTCDGNERS